MNIPLSPPFPKPGGSTTASLNQGQRFLLHDVSWDEYVTIGDALLDRPGLRMTYDRGALEFMTTSREHELFKTWIGRLLEALADEMRIAIAPGGNMTFRRKEVKRGFEPDECYWISQESHMRGRLTWEPEQDPPPDLILEVEISRSALNRMGIFSAMGVPEVWRCDTETIRVHLLQPGGTYEESPTSPTFPNVPLGEILRFARPDLSRDFLTAIREFREWVRGVIKPRRGRGKPGGKRKPRGSK